MSTETIWTEELESQIEGLHQTQLGTDEYTKTVNGVNGMMDRKIKMEELKNEARKLENEENKLEIEKAKLEHEKKVDKWKVITPIITAAVYAGINIWAVLNNQRFEKDAIYGNEGGKSASRNLLNLFGRVKG